MKQQFDNAFKLLMQQDIKGTITGSYMLGYQEGWNQDIDLFCYDQPSFTKILFFMHYNPMFQILEPLEAHKFSEYVNENKSSLDKLSLITIKFKYNLSIDINVIFKKHRDSIFAVLSSFDMDLISQGYDIQTQRFLSLRDTTGMNATWNRWNTNFYNKDSFWGCKRLLRQFERVVKYHRRGYDCSSVTDKYIELTEGIITMDNYYKTQKGEKFFNDTIEEFKVVLKILKSWKETLTISEEELQLLKEIY